MDPLVEKGIVGRMDKGVIAGYQLVDVKVTLFDGKYHDVDSSDGAFQLAGSKGFKVAVEKAAAYLLEPVWNLEVTVPDECMGDVMGDISQRRGKVQGMDSKGQEPDHPGPGPHGRAAPVRPRPGLHDRRSRHLHRQLLSLRRGSPRHPGEGRGRVSTPTKRTSSPPLGSPMASITNLDGCELGPIRPPSESTSLLLRVTRNCPWNKCAFCAVYKGTRFSRRDENDLLAELDVAREGGGKRPRANRCRPRGQLSGRAVLALVNDPGATEEERRVALWMSRGAKNVFLQDADSWFARPGAWCLSWRSSKPSSPRWTGCDHLRRSRTLVAKSDDELANLAAPA